MKLFLLLFTNLIVFNVQAQTDYKSFFYYDDLVRGRTMTFCNLKMKKNEANCSATPGDQPTSPIFQKNIKEISAGGFFGCFLDINHKVTCYKNPRFTMFDIDKIPEGLKATTIAAGDKHICAITITKNVVCWGRNKYGESTPPEGLSDVKYLAMGRSHSCAVTEDDEIHCWGNKITSRDLKIPYEGRFENIISFTSHFQKEYSWPLDHYVDFFITDTYMGKYERKSRIGRTAGDRYLGGGTYVSYPELDFNKAKVKDGECAIFNGDVLCEGNMYTGLTPFISNAVDLVYLSGEFACSKDIKGELNCWGNNVSQIFPKKNYKPKILVRYNQNFVNDESFMCGVENDVFQCFGAKKSLRKFENQIPQFNDITDIYLKRDFGCVLNSKKELSCFVTKDQFQPVITNNIKKLYRLVRTDDPKQYIWGFCVTNELGELDCFGSHKIISPPKKLKNVTNVTLKINSDVDELQICAHFQNKRNKFCWNYHQ